MTIFPHTIEHTTDQLKKQPLIHTFFIILRIDKRTVDTQKIKQMRIIQIAILLLFFSANFYSQEASIFGKGSPQSVSNKNIIDANGLKQGEWEKKHHSGNLMYKATFINDTLVGEMLRFHPNGQKMAQIQYESKGGGGDGKLFNEKGRKIAEGRFKGSNKEGEWSFYNESGNLLSKENYVNNKREGTAVNYYRNGKIASIVNWQNDQKHGEETSYYPNERKRLVANYENGELHGNYTVFYDNNFREITGAYNRGKMDGIWVFYHANGKEDYRLHYKLGVPKEAKKLEQKQIERFKEFEKNRGKLRDPEDYLDDPDSYMKGL